MLIMTDKGEKRLSGSDVIFYSKTKIILYRNKLFEEYKIDPLNIFTLDTWCMFYISVSNYIDDGENRDTLIIENLLKSEKMNEFAFRYPDIFISYRPVLKRYFEMATQNISEEIQLLLEL